ncbi:YncE family protein [Stenotrophomonas rhizophila]|uniref:YncE family protein n=1 Tax=Stenotrophomonas rhizophila TaxID=216778 RepID=UPI001E2F50AE|nr:ATP-binding protein [Stenotrophomonas rhizophila]MCC7635407.1 ATP-binding protein [Stenotrophomonas rhizophila]MCC7664364.1 ATP-binding protein [Stenotrophomonas rhizophila]
MSLRSSFRLTTLAAGLLLAVAGQAQPVFDQPASVFKGTVVSRGENVVPGSSAEVIGRGFVPGQQVSLVRGETVLNGQPLTVGADGSFKTQLQIPADAVPGTHPVVVRASQPAAATVLNLRVSPQLPLSGQAQFATRSNKLVPGLYQSAYSAASNAVFVTSAVGRPPVTQSQLLKLDPRTLKVTKAITPAPVPDAKGGSVFAVYGVGVDDANGNVWVTNTRQDTVAVYRQADLSLVHQFPVGTVPHARDVVVDAARGKVFASAAGEDHLSVFDAKTLQALAPISLASGVDDEKFVPMSLVLDEAGGKLFTVSIGTPEAAVIDVASGKVDKVIDLGNSISASGVAHDAQQNRLYVASQGTDNLLIVDVVSGKVLHDVAVGAGALNVAFDPKTGLAYVTSRGAGTVTVVDRGGKVVGNLDGGTFPNHVRADGKGNVFAVNKSRGTDDPKGDRITRIALRQR